MPEIKVGDCVELWVDWGDAESGPQEPTPTGVEVIDTDGVHILYESPLDGEPALMTVEHATLVPAWVDEEDLGYDVDHAYCHSPGGG